jgi:thioredoxin-like negative regulator of GroEL
MIGVLLTAAACVAIMGIAPGCGKPETAQSTATEAAPGQTQVAEPAAAPVVPPFAGRPRLLDLGAHKCRPCQMMAPILDDLKANHASHFETVFVDVWEHPAVGQEYGVRSIPTQIFFDAEGRERFRHVGFMAKEDILAKWKELGFLRKAEGTEAEGTK